MKIGVFGGTFNPIHNGHINLCTSFITDLKLDKVLLIPTYQPPHKKAEMLASGADRLKMCELVAQHNPKLEASDIELVRGGKSYTYQTLRQLKQQYPNDKLYLIMGSDMFLTVQDWVKPEVIFPLAVLCASSREDNEYEKLVEHKEKLEKTGAECIVEKFEVISVSSTQIRHAFLKNKDTSLFIPKYIDEYIRQNKLYTDF